MPTKIFSLITLFSFSILWASAQEPGVNTDNIRKDALNVYMDASDYIRKEIPYINYVRDLKEADVYIISTYQSAGSGGMQYTYFISGQNRFAGMADTVSFTSSPDDTQDFIREQQVKVLKMGLMRYVARTPLAKYINVSFTLPLRETVTNDKWNNWVFRTSVSGFLNGEKSYNYTNLYGNMSASKITEDWKVNISANYSYGVDKFNINGATYTSRNNSTSFNTLVVRSISDHWSYGGSLSAGASSYSNLKLSLSLMPGIEYDIYPYSQSTRKQLRLLYRAGFNPVFYNDTTIYNKTRENLWKHSLTAAYAVVQKWGSVDVSLGYSNYLHDWSKNNLSLDGDLSLRIAKGLNLELGGGVTLIHDQLSLVKGGATTEEVLLRRKQLETQYSFYAMFGFSYTFGSIYNNVVNPRFGSSGGGARYIIMN
ncbi:MAG TPA: hypothetical protein P5257_04040 [Bacteroidales bacterium]|nr:hypothetical protein [Bacteroidales bacterium]HRR93619.1 hypothetical protein [Bacteroidales bacterium]HRT89268.1 hypothetical protein [Bacteroidales bacterium]